ncbi:MAG: T9SS type A sorting domain-containing protein [bacterium]
MNLNRMNQLHTNYEDHTVLLFGGHGTNFISLNSCEIFDAVSEPSQVLTMNAPHDNASFVKLSDSIFLILGGSADLGVAPGNNVAEIFDAYNKTFSLLPVTMNYGRMYSGSTLLNNGNVLIGGGWYDEPSATYGEVYNPIAQTFTVTGALNTPRSGPTMVSTTDGKATLFGGTDIYGNTYYQNVEEYDPATNQFTTVSDYFFPGESNWRLGYQPKLNTSQQMTDGKYIYLIYNTDSLRYRLMTFDPETKTFEKYYTYPDLNIPSAYLVNDIVLSSTKVYGTIIYSFLENETRKIGAYMVTFSFSSLAESNNIYTMPSAYSLGSASIDPVGQESLMICGGTTGVGYDYNFMPVNNTLFVWFFQSEVKELDNNIPTEYSLAQNYPNPFNPSTKIRFSLNTSGNVSLKIFDILGKEITTLVNEYMDAGNYEADFNVSETGKNLSSGVYIYQLKLKDKILSNKMMILE